jgi:hypothetical protein
MGTLESSRPYLDDYASDFAFRTGQLVERLLVQRGVQAALDEEKSVITLDIIQSCVDQTLLDQLRSHLHERAEQESRKVA